ncbi:DUF2917 domain-containing protein [Undibacterium crateris]|uniref:DUF2917 domain-containing protein n=1 Tax=Undibacterium crateris TaxID=2528175 RepID=UPI0013895F28|nr:DUF2917 domain-containing protein [Undibacterium crateris]NDI87365.1 DUF2917 domain-containing protein [Undibacterium crateris]
MTNNFANPSYTITAGKTLSGVSPVDRQIKVVCGRIWLTIAGDDSDFWLATDETVVIPAHRMVVLEADQQASRIELQTVTSPAAAHQSEFAVTNYLQKLTQKLNHVFA